MLMKAGAISPQQSQSDHIGIETLFSAKMMVSFKYHNQTILELKHSWKFYSLTSFFYHNQTILELKQNIEAFTVDT
jgi:flagellar biosynthesis protein FliR